MKKKLLCKACKSTVESGEAEIWVYCPCGKVGICASSYEGREADLVSGGSDAYKVVDDKGNEILLQSEFIGPVSDEEVYRQLMADNESQIEYIEKFSPNLRFAPSSNQDIAALRIWLKAMFENLRKLLKRDP